MSQLNNSTRTNNQATYSPIEIKDPPLLIRAWEKWTFFASLLATMRDFSALGLKLKRKAQATSDAKQKKKLEQAFSDFNTLAKIIPQFGKPDALSSVKILKDISVESLITLGEEHLESEESRVNRLLNGKKEIEKTYKDAHPPVEMVTPEIIPPSYKLVKGGIPHAPELEVYRYEKIGDPGKLLPEISKKITAPTKGKPAEPDDTVSISGGESKTIRVMAIPKVELIQKKEVLPSIPEGLQLDVIANWAINNGIRVADAKELLVLDQKFEITNYEIDLKSLLLNGLSTIKQLIDGFKVRMKVEPIGLLHLEHLSFTPAGIERGELVNSIPLSPGEEVNYIHREWSNTSQEYEKLVTDYMENFSEEGVSEKSELAEASSSQTQHTSGLNTGVTVSGGYGPVKLTSSFSYNVQDSATNASQESRRRTQQNTQKSSSRTKKEHKTSFRVASASGAEDQSVRKIKNSDTVNPVRIDLYRLIRKWRVDLERYGLRLTYDITIPEPGSDILARHLEIRELKKKLTEDFSFPLSPSNINRGNYLTYAAQYKASIESPPPDELIYTGHNEKNWPDYDAAKRSQFHALEFNVSTKYKISKVETFENYFHFLSGSSVKGKPKFWWEIDSSELLGTTGKVSVVYLTDDLASYYVFVKITAKLRPEELEQWKLKVWKALYDAAETTFLANQKRYKDRISDLEEELGEDDALTLRKIEREEVMKGVLRWLFGPTFRFAPEGLPVGKKGLSLFGSAEQVASEKIWSKMLAHGEFIKFLHNAIEWENMLYFLYPYFWTHPSEWEDRKYLQHTDSIHQQFLKAGCTRVVVTIRPKFEDSFLSLIETGDFSSLPQNHPYVSIATEMRNYAKTNYPGIPSANPAKHGGAWRQILTFAAALEKFYTDCGRYPTTTEGLAALVTDPGAVGWDGPYVQTVPKDPWQNPYVYKSPGDHGGFDIISYGKDGQLGGIDENADVVSWAKGSLIGSWFEYTPTSALDIALGDKLPEA